MTGGAIRPQRSSLASRRTDPAAAIRHSCVWCDVSGLADSSEVCARLLSDARVSVNDGKNYGPGGEKGFRIVLGVYRDNERVRNALLRIREVLLQMAQEKGLSVQ